MRERQIGDILMTFFLININSNFLYALNFLRFCTLWVPDIYSLWFVFPLRFGWSGFVFQVEKRMAKDGSGQGTKIWVRFFTKENIAVFPHVDGKKDFYRNTRLLRGWKLAKGFFAYKRFEVSSLPAVFFLIFFVGCFLFGRCWLCWLVSRKDSKQKQIPMLCGGLKSN